MGSLADTVEAATKKCVRYTAEQRASIGKYALENRNKRARRHFSFVFANISESTVRNFKKAYTEKLQQEKKPPYPQPVVKIPEGGHHFH